MHVYMLVDMTQRVAKKKPDMMRQHTLQPARNRESEACKSLQILQPTRISRETLETLRHDVFSCHWCRHTVWYCSIVAPFLDLLVQSDVGL